MNSAELSARMMGIHWLTETDSTNTQMRLLWEADKDLSHGTMLVTDNQVAGRGRQGRDWQTPAGEALAISLLVRGFGETALAPGWLALIVGSAVASAVDPLLGVDLKAKVKWPNDVHLVREDESGVGAKIAGILCEMLPDGAVIIGAGLNVLTPSDRLPTDRAGSLFSCGANLGGLKSLREGGTDELVAGILGRFYDETEALMLLAKEDTAALRSRIVADSHTLGKSVRVELPGGSIILGTADRLAADGSIVVRDAKNELHTVSAGDVWHLREANAPQ